MEKKSNPRIEKLTFLLKQMDKIHLRDAAQMLDVSEMTIRRDLSQDDESLVLLGGYIVRNPQYTGAHNYQIFEHQGKNIAQKMQIGQQAAALIEEGDRVFFDCGSTIPFIISHIAPDLKFSALCCSINCFLLLQEKPHCDIILCGGRYSRHNSFINSFNLKNELELVCTDKAFISAAGVDAKRGVTCFNFDEANAKQKAMAKTKESILLFDHSKINQVQQAYVGEIGDFDRLICDQKLPAEFGRRLSIK